MPRRLLYLTVEGVLLLPAHRGAGIQEDMVRLCVCVCVYVNGCGWHVSVSESLFCSLPALFVPQIKNLAWSLNEVKSVSEDEVTVIMDPTGLEDDSIMGPLMELCRKHEIPTIGEFTTPCTKHDLPAFNKAESIKTNLAKWTDVAAWAVLDCVDLNAVDPEIPLVKTDRNVGINFHIADDLINVLLGKPRKSHK